MPYLKNYRLLISHSWNYANQYDTIVFWLNESNYFKWSNHSISCDRPIEQTTEYELKQKLTSQIKGCSAIIVISGMYVSYSKWIDYEIGEASRMGKPIICVRPRGNEKVPKVILDNATVLVGWNCKSLVDAVRIHAI